MNSVPIMEPDVLKDARLLYRAHRNAATKPTKAENLDKVWEILNCIWDEGGRDYSIAEVGRRLEKIGGPKTQSLRNAQGVHYRDIITAYATAVSGATRYVAKTKSNVERALSLISDPSVRATIRVALEEAKRLKVVNDNLHAAFKSLQLGANVSTNSVLEQAQPLSAQTQVQNILSPRLMSALRKGINSSRLAQQGMHAADDGSIKNENGDILFPPAFVFAIQAVVSQQD